MRIYISGSEEPEKRKQVKAVLEKNGHEVIDSQEGEKPSWVLSVSKRGKIAVRLSLISRCDVIFMMDGWQKCNIAKQEFNKAAEEKLIICFENGKVRDAE